MEEKVRRGGELLALIVAATLIIWVASLVLGLMVWLTETIWSRL